MNPEDLQLLKNEQAITEIFTLPKVFIVMSTYNRQALLNTCIERISTQTFKDWSLLVINDCCKDSTSNILDFWVKYDHRIKILTNRINQGAICKIPHMMSTKSPYVCLVDDDDLWEPNYLEEQIKGLENHNDKVMGFTDCWYVKGQKKRYSKSKGTKFYLEIVPSCVIFKTEVFQKLGGFDPELKDYHAELDLYFRLGGLPKFNHIKKPLVYINRNNDTMSTNKKTSAEKLIILISKNWKLFKSNKPMLSEFFKIVGLNYIEANETKKGKKYLKDSLQVKFNIEAFGALILVNINRLLFLYAYRLYREILGYV